MIGSQKVLGRTNTLNKEKEFTNRELGLEVYEN